MYASDFLIISFKIDLLLNPSHILEYVPPSIDNDGDEETEHKRQRDVFELLVAVLCYSFELTEYERTTVR